MQDLASLRALCLNEDGSVRPRAECRATLINHFILASDDLDVDGVETQVDAAMRELALWEETTDA